MSLAAFLARPESEGRSEELLDGELVVSPEANEHHCWIATQLVLQLAPQFARLGRFCGQPITPVARPGLCASAGPLRHRQAIWRGARQL